MSDLEIFDLGAVMRDLRVRAATPDKVAAAALLADPTYHPDAAPFVRFVSALAECAPNPAAMDRRFAASMIAAFAGFRGHQMPDWFAELGIDAVSQHKAGEVIGELVKRAVRQ